MQGLSEPAIQVKLQQALSQDILTVQASMPPEFMQDASRVVEGQR
jgi:hypothetical protein